MSIEIAEAPAQKKNVHIHNSIIYSHYILVITIIIAHRSLP